jgi:hypothetical protein
LSRRCHILAAFDAVGELPDDDRDDFDDIARRLGLNLT